MPPDSVTASASMRMRCLYSAVGLRRLALATTSGFGRAAGFGSPPSLAATGLRSASLRSPSLRSSATKLAGGWGRPLGLVILASFSPLLTDYGHGKCLTHVGTEGRCKERAKSAGHMVSID